MNFLLIIVIIIPIVFIGFLASELDRFLENKGFACEPAADVPTAVVLGTSELARHVAGKLEKGKINVVAISEPLIFKQQQRIEYLFALSDDDVDNITICKIVKKVYGTDKIISLCNNQRNLNMYTAEDIKCISGKETAEQSIYRLVPELGAIL